MQQSTSRQNEFAKIALSRLYDVQLCAKYAYTGCLGNHLQLFLFLFMTGKKLK